MKLNKEYIVIALIMVLLALSTWIGFSQTNMPPLPNPAAAQPFPDTTAQDWVKALGDIGIHINVTTIGSILFLVYYGSKVVRNKIAPNSPLAKILASWVNAEQSPTTLPPVPSQSPKT